MDIKFQSRNRVWVVVGCAIALVFLLSCSTFQLTGQQPDPTLTALYMAVESTVTARALQGGGENEGIATAQARATATSLAVAARQTERVSGHTEEEQATATVVAPVVAELQVYGLDPTDGELAWIHNPITLTVNGYHVMDFANDYPQVTARDFVLVSDITWDTRYGSNGCGFAFRSNGNQNKPSQYIVVASRFALGRVVFTAVMDGELNNIHEFYPKDEDNSFDWENDRTNRLAIIARGPKIEIYTNLVKIAEFLTTDPPDTYKPPPIERPKDLVERTEYDEIVAQVKTYYATALKNNREHPAIFDNGFLGMVVLSEAGLTTCKFTDTWLWLIGE